MLIGARPLVSRLNVPTLLDNAIVTTDLRCMVTPWVSLTPAAKCFRWHPAR